MSDNHQKATTLFYQLANQAKQGYVNIGRHGYCNVFLEASLKITGKENILKIPTSIDLGGDEDDFLEFLDEIKANPSQDKLDYFELSIYYDENESTNDLMRQLNLSTCKSDYVPIMLKQDQAIEIIKGLLDAGVIQMIADNWPSL